MWKKLLVVLFCIFFSSSITLATSTFSNNGGGFDGEYKATIKNLTKKTVEKNVKIEIENQYVTIKRADQEPVQYKFREIFDRRYEKEINLTTFDTRETLVIIFK
ncbi:hypothetical protein IJT10_05130 [bacterium]|nr:hypothetical protein [bacterium]